MLMPMPTDDQGSPAGAAGAAANLAESGLTEPGLAEAGLTEPGLAEAGLAEAGLAEAGLAEAGLAEAGLAEAGLAEAGRDYGSTLWEPGPQVTERAKITQYARLAPGRTRGEPYRVRGNLAMVGGRPGPVLGNGMGVLPGPR